MATMNVSLPDKMKQWVEEQVQTGRYGNASDYVRDLVRRDQERSEAREKLQQMVDDYVQPLCQQGADTIVLGCTHYPFLVSLIQASAGQQVRIIDPAPAVVRELQRRLAEQHLLSNNTARGQVAFWTSGSIQQARFIIPQLWQDGEAPDIRHWSS